MNDRRPDEGVDPDAVDAVRTLLAPVGEVQDVAVLAGGFFATSYRADLADGTRLVVKTAPAATDRLLTYEKDLVRAEALTYRTAEPYPDLLMPHVVLTDFSRTLLPGDVVVATWAQGVPAEQAGAVAERTRGARDRRLGRLMADLHRLHGVRYGYLDPETHLRGDSWAEALTAMVDQILADG